MTIGGRPRALGMLAAILFAASTWAYDAPFLTSADMRAYFTDTYGIVQSDGGPAVFCHADIQGVLVDGEALPVLRCGRDWVQVDMPAGEHEVRIQVSDSSASRPSAQEEPTMRHEGAIRSAEDLAARVKQAKPGDTLIVADGVYADWRVTIPCKGTKEQPIVIRPETPGGAMLRLKTRITLTGDWVVFRGFRFEHCYQYAVHIKGGSHNRITQCQFFHCGSPHSTFGHILRVDMASHHNRVDHCYWTGSKCMSLGQRNDTRRPEAVGKHNRYDHNIFRDIIRIWINGQENIQLGQGVPWDAEPMARVEYNLFDNAWGDGEIFSSKTSRNTFRHNVAAHCTYAAYTLRGGDNAAFDGNIAYRCAGGVRIFGRHHKIVNNLFLEGTRAAVVFQIGHKHGKSEGVPATNCLIAHNTFLNNNGGIAAAGTTEREDWRPRGNRIVNNIFVAPTGFFISAVGHFGPSIRDNLFWSTEMAEIGLKGDNALVADPALEGVGTGIGLCERSPAIDRAVSLADVTHDRNDNPRPWGKASDLGADEYIAKDQPRKILPMPFIPTARPWSIEFFKGATAFACDTAQPLKGWQKGDAARAADGIITLKDGALPFAGTLPDEFVMEWEYQPDSFASKGSLTFSGSGDAQGYCLTWGGTAKDGKPCGILSLHKNGELIAECPDTVYYRRNYIPAFPNKMVAITSPGPNPLLWYHCRLIKWCGEIRLILNTAARVSKGKPRNVRDVPVLIWEDAGTVAGPALHGSGLTLRQEGTGRWRNVRIWKAEYIGNVPPPAPTDLKAEAHGGGRIRLSWRHGDDVGRRYLYNVFRSTTPDFTPDRTNQIAWRTEAKGFDDFDVEPGHTYHYKVRAVNLLDVESPAATASATAGQGGPTYLLVDAGTPASIKPPMAIGTEPTSGRRFLMAASGGGHSLKAPPERGHADYEFTVAQAGTYRVWAYVIAPDSGSNSFWTRSPVWKEGTPWIFHVAECERWAWRPMGGPVGLKQGPQTLRFMPRESGTRLLRLLVTSDLDWEPMDARRPTR